jgi:hypothetical protein
MSIAKFEKKPHFKNKKTLPAYQFGYTKSNSVSRFTPLQLKSKKINLNTVILQLS